MLSTTSGPLRAFSWFLSSTTPTIAVKIQDQTGGSATISITHTDVFSDIALADDASNPGVDYIVGVVYVAINQVYLNTYRITGVGSSLPLGVTFLSSIHLNASGSIGNQPHIDMFADIGTPINGLPSMHQFIISWTEQSGSTVTQKAAYGDIATPASLTTYSLASGPNVNEVWDVAASYNLTTGINYAYFLSQQGVNLDLVQLDCSSSATTSTLLTSTSTNQGFPRIEAMGLYDPATSPNPWTAIVPLNSSPSANIYVFNNTYPSGFICSPSFPYQTTVDGTAIAAGVGIPFSSDFCNENYSMGWGVSLVGTNMSIARAVDYLSGFISSSFPDYYQINTLLFPIGTNHGMLAMSSCSNSGKFLLTAWINQSAGRIFYKLTGDVHHYKPTGITTLHQESLSLFPNPAMEHLTLKGLSQDMNYSIVSLVGRTMVSGKVTEDHPLVNTQNLLPGIYLLRLTGKDGQSSQMKFIKE